MMRAQRLRFQTTTFVLAECGNAAARRPYRLEVDVLRTRLEKRGEIVVPTDDDWSLAWDARLKIDTASNAPHKPLFTHPVVCPPRTINVTSLG